MNIRNECIATYKYIAKFCDVAAGSNYRFLII